MKYSKKISVWLTLAMLVLSAFLAFGVIFIFHACGPREDGSFMRCHRVQNTIAVFAACIFLISLFSLFFRGKILKILTSSLIGILSVITSLLPKVIMKMCMKDTMRCYTIMRPAVILICALIFILALADVLYVCKNDKAAAL